MEKEEGEDYHLKEPENVFKKIIEENFFPNLKKEMAINVQEAFRTPNRLQKRQSACDIIIKTLHAQNKGRIY